MAARASLVQDVYLGFQPRLRAKRLSPWREPATRLLLHLDASGSLAEPATHALLESLAERLEVIAWEPQLEPSATAALDEARRIVADGVRRFGERPTVVGGIGLGGWIALAAAPAALAAGVAQGILGVFALAPSLEKAGPAAPQPAALRAALATALAQAPLELPCLVLEGRQRPAAEARVVAEWLALTPRATHLVATGSDADLVCPPWPQVVSAWADALERPAP